MNRSSKIATICPKKKNITNSKGENALKKNLPNRESHHAGERPFVKGSESKGLTL